MQNAQYDTGNSKGANIWRHSTIHWNRLLLLPIAFTLSGCGGGVDINTDPGPVCTVTVTGISPVTASVVMGGTQQLNGTVNAVNCPTAPVLTWASNAINIASVNTAGLVTGITPGTAVISASAGASSAQAIVTVTPVPVATVEISQSALSLQVGSDKGTVTAVARDQQGNILSGRAIAWQSLSPSIALVNANGASVEVTGIALGNAAIQATSEGRTAIVQVSVVASPQVPMAWALVRGNGTIATFTNLAIAGAGRITVQRSAIGTYQVSVAGIGTDAGPKNYAWHVATLAGVPVTQMFGPWATCNTTTLYPWSDQGKADVICRSAATGAIQDADFRITVIADNVLGGTRAPLQRAMFSQGGPGVNSLTGYAPLIWNSAGLLMSTAENPTTGRNRHTHGIQLREPYIYFVDVRAVLNRPLEACSLEREDVNDADVYCTARDGTPGAYHMIMAFEQGRAGLPWGYAKVTANGAPTATRSRNPFGNTTITRFSTGRYEVTFTGAQAATDPAVLVSPSMVGGFRACAHTLQSLLPVTIQVACWNATGQFADSDFNVGFLR